jgi:glutathione synthase/RimK-type ligase-like ATP-grasp enzyme
LTVTQQPPVIALVTAREARALDEDLPPLKAALANAGVDVRIVDWDDAHTDWSAFDLALLRSTWDYTMRLPEFLIWAERASEATRLANPLALVRWNTDKHYLGELAGAEVRTVATTFVEPGESAARVINEFLLAEAASEFVVKPAVSSGSRDTQRYGRRELEAATAHIKRLLNADRSVLLQPYLERVDADGETALIYFGGRFSHAVRKGPILLRGAGATKALFAPEQISPRVAKLDELRTGERALAAIPFDMPLYARVDLIRDPDGAPRVLELELTEPSLFFAHAPDSVERFVALILDYHTDGGA